MPGPSGYCAAMQVASSPTARTVAPLVTTLTRRLADASKSGPTNIVGVAGGFAALLLAELQRQLGQRLVIVVPDETHATILEDGLSQYLPHVSEAASTRLHGPLDHIPFQGMSPPRLAVMDRVTTLFKTVHDPTMRALVVPASTLIDKLMPREALLRHRFQLSVGDLVSRKALLGFLSVTGYHRVPAVEDAGTFAVRGGIIDIYSAADAAPVRIEFWDDEIDTIRRFDPATQETLEQVEILDISPARDIIFTHETIQAAKQRILALADKRLVPTSQVRALIEDLEHGTLQVGMEDLLPLFHPHLDTLFDIVGPDAVWVVEDPERCAEAMSARWEELVRRAGVQHADGDQSGSLTVDADALFVPAKTILKTLAAKTRLQLVPFEEAGKDAVRFETRDHQALVHRIQAALRDGDEHVLSSLAAAVHSWREDDRVVVACAHSEGGIERLDGLIRHYGVRVRKHDGPFLLAQLPELRADDAQLHLFVGTPGRGFDAPDLGLVVLDEHEILGKPPRKRPRRRRVPPEQVLQSWRDLSANDFVSHLTHGIGQFQGLTKRAVDGVETDFLILEYADANKLFVPVEKLHLVSKHQATEAAPPRLDKLGGAGWQRTTKRVKKAVRNIADKLLKLYAKREASEGYAFSAPDGYFRRFEAAFPYEETADQARAIDETLADMQKLRPMDRLICGDVGFGKTEVAMRAAFKAILDGKQVAILVPTQVLAEQHRLTFTRRFDGFPVLIESLSRLQGTKAQRATLARITSGAVDIVIGTHRILSKDVDFADLGLVIIDEEHRFGVAQKERLKTLRASVDLLTLTATPIPRTLNFAMVGLRDISLIQTPPTDRLPVRTLLARPIEETIREAIARELARGGQVFFVHNRVSDIARQAELIQRIVPEARVAVGHGQMKAEELDKVMLRFVRGEANVLVCTTIIESGIDIPNANTMLIDRADRFGLAQLYQLRGRVGRSSVRAYCFLLVPSPSGLAGDAKARLQAIQRFSELGSGFSIASYDLDIRGAGDILGAEQAGNINAVGYDAFMDLLREAIAETQAENEGLPVQTR
ncbi:MAG: transcription-repair coupling factor (superfamily II helicase), partial [Myxococcota bacterium]